jgi:hypothetical protein
MNHCSDQVTVMQGLLPKNLAVDTALAGGKPAPYGLYGAIGSRGEVVVTICF